MTVALVVLIGIIICAIFITPIWLVGYWRSGARAVISPRPAEELIDNAVRGFIELGWIVKEERQGYVWMERGPSGGTGCLLSALFLPLGLAYLLTDWGRGKLIVEAVTTQKGMVNVYLIWRNAGIRSDVEDFCSWLLQQEEARSI